MALLIDLETTGLPKNRQQCRYTNIENYDTCRVVQISWLVCDNHLRIVAPVQDYVVHRPLCTKDYTITPKSVEFHGITHNIAAVLVSDGGRATPINIIATALLTALRQVSHIIAHNIDFDVNVLLSELYRRAENTQTNETDAQTYRDCISLIRAKKQCCTMSHPAVRNLTHNNKWLRLEELYGLLVPKPLTLRDAHNSMFDIIQTYHCVVLLKHKGVLFNTETFVYAPEANKPQTNRIDIVYQVKQIRTVSGLVVSCLVPITDLSADTNPESAMVHRYHYVHTHDAHLLLPELMTAATTNTNTTTAVTTTEPVDSNPDWQLIQYSVVANK